MPSFCIIKPGSCSVADTLAGGDVFDLCPVAADAPAPSGTKQCVKDLVNACSGGCPDGLARHKLDHALVHHLTGTAV